MPRETAKAAEPVVPLLRRFNRSYTRLIGSLAKGYLETPYSLQEARVLFEVATDPGCTAKDICARAGFDQGYLSRLVSRLAAAGLLRKAASESDGRAQRLTLTPKGERAFRTLDARANEQARALLAPLDSGKRAEAAAALATLQQLLAPDDAEGRVRIRAHRAGDLGWVFHRHGVVYKEEFGYADVFETYVCEGLPPFLRDHDPARDRLWIAELDGRPVGSVAVHHVDDRPGWAKLRWFLVEREARGHGVGRRLLATALRFSRRAGYEGVFLWTVNDLHAARALYERAGFQLAEETDGCAWAPWGREQRWELPLRKPAARRA